MEEEYEGPECLRSESPMGQEMDISKRLECIWIWGVDLGL